VRAPISTEEERTAFLEALERSLRPLMPVVFKYGVSFQDLSEAMSSVYLSAVSERLEEQGRSLTESRLGQMTGISKGEVQKLQATRGSREQQRATAAKRTEQLSQLLSFWHDNSRFSTPYGAPLELSLKPEGTFRTFDQLILESGVTLDRESAIKHLVDARCIEIHGTHFIRCVNRSLISANADVTQIHYIGRSSAALNTTLVHNFMRDKSEDAFFERTLISDFPLSETGKSQLQFQLKLEGADFINELDKWVSGKESDFFDKNGKRFGVTMFLFDGGKVPATPIYDQS
jgi:hypothetical protein